MLCTKLLPPLIFLLLQLLAVSSSSSRGFGSSCSKRKECVASKGLACLKGICQCSNPEAHIYSDTDGLCVVKVGRRCSSEEAENSTDEGELQCIENAECRKLKLRKWCRCREGFRSNPEGTVCSPISRFGEPCSPSSEFSCDGPSGTVCLGGTCQCPFGPHQFFDKVLKKCVSYASGNCSIPHVSPCVSNAECISVQLRTGYTSTEGVKKIHTKTNTECHCIRGFTESKDGECMAGPGHSCDAHQPCNTQAFLSCIDGKCGCRNPLHEILDEDSQTCVSLVGSPCGLPGGLACTKNAECHGERRRCECAEGFSVGAKKECQVGHLGKCEPHTCNAAQGLVCVNGVCECFDSHLVFDKEAAECVGLSSSSDLSEL